jgi:hypothetical protein
MTRYLAVLAVVACGAAACTPTPQMVAPTPPDVRARIHHLGILGPPSLRLTYEEPTPGAGAGYRQGMEECGAAAVTGGVIGMTVGLLGCVTIGGLIGAVANVSETEVAEARAGLERIHRENSFREGLRGDLARLLAREAPQYAVALLAPDGTDPLGAPVDTVLALTDPNASLLPCSRSSTTAGKSVTLYAWVDAELLRAADRAVLRRARIEYWGETFAFTDWGATGGERLALGLANAQRSLAEQLAQSFFLAERPTAMTWPFCKNQPWRKRLERPWRKRWER